MKHKFLLAGLLLLFSFSLSAETYSGTCNTNAPARMSPSKPFLPRGTGSFSGATATRTTRAPSP